MPPDGRFTINGLTPGEHGARQRSSVRSATRRHHGHRHRHQPTSSSSWRSRRSFAVASCSRARRQHANPPSPTVLDLGAVRDWRIGQIDAIAGAGSETTATFEISLPAGHVLAPSGADASGQSPWRLNRVVMQGCRRRRLGDRRGAERDDRERHRRNDRTASTRRPAA